MSIFDLLPGTVNVLTRPVTPSGGAPVATTPGLRTNVEYNSEINKTVNFDSPKLEFSSDEFIADVMFSRLIPMSEVALELPGHVFAHLFAVNGIHYSETDMILEAIAAVDCFHAPLKPTNTISSVIRFHRFYKIVNDGKVHNYRDKIIVRYIDEKPRTCGIIVGFPGPVQVVVPAGAQSGPDKAHETTSVKIPLGLVVKTRDKKVDYPRRVVCLGDSITAACVYDHKDAFSAAKLCGYSLHLKKKMSMIDKGSEVYKLGYGGEQTKHLLHATGRNSKKLWKQIDGKTSKGGFQVALRLNPTDIIIMAGVNDLASGVSAAKTIANLTAMYTRAKNAGIRVIGVTIIPWGSHKPHKFGPTGKTVKASKWFPRYKKINHFIRTTPLLDAVVDTEPTMGTGDTARPPSLQKRFRRSSSPTGDQLHPNNAGQRFLGELIFRKALQKIVQEKKKPASSG